jgi:hypothetical protein
VTKKAAVERQPIRINAGQEDPLLKEVIIGELHRLQLRIMKAPSAYAVTMAVTRQAHLLT